MIAFRHSWEASMSAQPAVLFDLDGVLVDSYRAHFDSWLQLCQERGWSMTPLQFETTFGRTSREIIRELWGQEVDSDAEVKELDDRKEWLFREILARRFPVMEGAVELIDQLSEAGFALAIGSSAPPENVQLALDRLQRRHAFNAIVTAADVTRGKPDPQVYVLAAERLGLAPSHCVVIEDAPIGLQAARAAGMKCVGLVSTGRRREELAAANLVVDHLRELSPAILRRVIAG
jgi:beta-phosphoglucomutase